MEVDGAFERGADFLVPEDDPQGRSDGEWLQAGLPGMQRIARGKSFNKASCIWTGPLVRG